MINARGLTRTFITKQGKVRTEVNAVIGVDLDVAEGEIVGFLGPTVRVRPRRCGCSPRC